jgi:ribose-phosphate pyrophosphokinase
MIQVLSGSSNQDLAAQIAQGLQTSLIPSTSTKFANGEARVAVYAEQSVDITVLVQSLSSPVDEHLVEFCLLADALRRGGSSQLIGVIPWLGYSKQDKVFLPGEALSAQVVAQIIQTTQITKLITFDLHNRGILEFFTIPVVELSARPLFLDYFRPKVNAQTVIVAPDLGSVRAGKSYATALKVPFVQAEKQRDLHTGTVTVHALSGSVAGLNVIMIDDMIVTGSTLLENVRMLKEAGAARISFAATHHLWLPGVQVELERSAVDEIVVTDTVSPKGKGKKLTILSVAQLLVDELA